ncbi:MAG TPA: T9SS type A sorting domain-containing protein [Flavobacterium sp.]|jgi:hypothetical protein
MKKIILTLLAFVCCGAGAQTISHSTSMALGTTNVACNNGTAPNNTSSDNRYYRFFNLANFGITGQYTASAVHYGVQTMNVPTLPGGFPVTTKIYVTTNTTFTTAFFPAGYTEIASVTTNHQPTDVGTLVTIPITAVIPPGSNLLVELGYAAQAAGSLNRIFLSANDLGQSAPTYLSSTGCSIANPTDMATIGFADAHLVLSVDGTTLGLSKFDLAGVSIYPNPASNRLNFVLPPNVELLKASLSDIAGKQIKVTVSGDSVDLSPFNAGVYILTLETNEGTVNRKFIKQ